MTFEELKNEMLLAEFKDSEFKQLRAICDIRLGNTTGVNLTALDRKLPAYTQTFYDQLSQLLRPLRIHTPPLAVLKKTKPKAYADTVSCANVLFAVAEDWNQASTMRRPFVTGVYRLYCKLVIDYLKYLKIPVSITTAVKHSDKFVGLVDNAYPGYVEGGMVNMLLLGPGRTDSFGEIIIP